MIHIINSIIYVIIIIFIIHYTFPNIFIQIYIANSYIFVD